ncbi:MAG TPA: hypothetical protein PL045_07110, partial [Chitinophagaceae bacterium]|nr:hypothetical protein [Chitinophagaceae bacterium]
LPLSSSSEKPPEFIHLPSVSGGAIVAISFEINASSAYAPTLRSGLSGVEAGSAAIFPEIVPRLAQINAGEANATKSAMDSIAVCLEFIFP